MATLALGLAGNALLPGVGGIVGGMIGSYLDNQIIMPALFGEQGAVVNQGKVDSIRYTGADEGASVHYVDGSQVRISGTVIYLGKIRTDVTSTEQPQGGKGGGGKKKTKVKTFNYFGTWAVSLGEVCPGAKLRKLWADAKLIFDDGGQEDARLDSITFYDGRNRQYPSFGSQVADPIILAKKLADEVSSPTTAYKGTMYVLINELNLADWGNRIPSITALIEVADEMPVQTSIAKLCRRAKLTDGQFDVTRVPRCLLGLSVSGPTPVNEPMRVLMTAFNLNMQDQGNKLVFFSKDNADVIDVAADDLGSVPFKIEFTRATKSVLPSNVNVTYIDPEQDWQPATQPANEANGSDVDVETVQLPIVMYQPDANALAARLLWASRVEATRVRLTLPSKYSRVLEGDVLRITTDDTYLIRVTSITRGVDFSLEIDGLLQNNDTFVHTGVYDPREKFVNRPYSPPIITAMPMNLPALEPGDEEDACVYVTGRRVDPRATFAGGIVHVSNKNENGGYKEIETLLYEGNIGAVVETDVAVNDSSRFVWDWGTTIYVSMPEPLSSVSEEEAYDGQGAIAIGNAAAGWEVIFYQSAVEDGGIDPVEEHHKVYALTGLLRGRRGTEQTFHAQGEQVVQLTPSTLVRHAVNHGANGRRFYKVVGSQGLIADAPPTTLELEVATHTPWAPAYIKATGGASGSRIVTWSERSRGFLNDWLIDVPQSTDSNKYKFELYDANNGGWITLGEPTATTFTLTNSHRTTNGWPESLPVLIRISQWSAFRKKYGRAREAWV